MLDRQHRHCSGSGPAVDGMSAIAIIVLFSALLYGWLYAYGVTGLRGWHGTGALTPAQRSA
jgi:hypothetical protein